jgi:hypothetical protein
MNIEETQREADLQKEMSSALHKSLGGSIKELNTVINEFIAAARKEITSDLSRFKSQVL